MWLSGRRKNLKPHQIIATFVSTLSQESRGRSESLKGSKILESENDKVSFLASDKSQNAIKTSVLEKMLFQFVCLKYLFFEEFERYCISFSRNSFLRYLLAEN